MKKAEIETIKGYKDSELRSVFMSILDRYPIDYQNRLLAFVELQCELNRKETEQQKAKEIFDDIDKLIWCGTEYCKCWICVDYKKLKEKHLK